MLLFLIKVFSDLSRALRVKNETSISENLVREYGPHLELGVEVKKRERVFVTNLYSAFESTIGQWTLVTLLPTGIFRRYTR